MTGERRRLGAAFGAPRAITGDGGGQHHRLRVGGELQRLRGALVDQAADVFTTDPQLVDGRYTLLDDPELLFGSQNVVMVVDEGKLDSIDSDAFMDVIDTVNSELTEDAMIAMNAEVTEGRSEGDVARAFLRRVGLMTPLRS